MTRADAIAFGFLAIVATLVGASGLDRGSGDPILVGALIVALLGLAVSDRRSRPRSHRGSTR